MGELRELRTRTTRKHKEHQLVRLSSPGYMGNPQGLTKKIPRWIGKETKGKVKLLLQGLSKPGQTIKP